MGKIFVYLFILISPANISLVSILITLGDVTDILNLNKMSCRSNQNVYVGVRAVKI